MRAYRCMFLAAILVTAFGCHDTEGGREGDGRGATGEAAAALVTDVDQYIVSLGQPPAPAAESRTETPLPNTTNTSYDSVFQLCRRAAVAETRVFGDPDYVSLNPIADALFPGALVRSSGLREGQLNHYKLPRAGGTITIDNISAQNPAQATPRSRTLTNVTKATVEAARDDILTAVPLDIGANLQVSSHRASSLTEAAIAADLDVETAKAELSAAFGATWTTQKNSFLLTFVQSFYTISFAYSGQPHDLFAPSVDLADIQLQMPPGDQPAFVSTVTYGRRLLVKVETNLESSTLQADLEGAFQQAATSGSASLSASQRKLLSNTSLTVVVQGGPEAEATAIATASGAVTAATTDAEAQAAVSGLANAIKNYIGERGPLPLGIPLSYAARLVANSSLVKVAQTGNYEERECFDRAVQADVNLKELFIYEDGEAIGRGEIFYDVFVNGAHVAEGDDIKRGNGESIAINLHSFPKLPVIEGEPLVLRVIASEAGKKVDQTRTHQVHVSPAGAVSFLPQGSQEIVGETGNLKVGLRYTLTTSNVLP